MSSGRVSIKNQVTSNQSISLAELNPDIFGIIFLVINDKNILFNLSRTSMFFLELIAEYVDKLPIYYAISADQKTRETIKRGNNDIFKQGYNDALKVHFYDEIIFNLFPEKNKSEALKFQKENTISVNAGYDWGKGENRYVKQPPLFKVKCNLKNTNIGQINQNGNTLFFLFASHQMKNDAQHETSFHNILTFKNKCS